MRLLKRWLVYFLALLLSCACALWPLPAAAPTARYQLKSWTTDNGLPQNSVNKVVQSGDGYIWLATNDGLVRFDGVKFTVFNSQNLPQLQSNRILDIIESRDGSLWLGTEGGGVVVKRKKDRHTAYTASNGLAGNVVSNLFEDSEGRMWIVTNKGLNFFKDGKLHTFTTANGLSNNLAYRVFEDSHHNLWIATGDDVLNRFHDGSVTHIREGKGRLWEYIHTIYEDREHNVWFGCVERMSRFKDGVFTKVPLDYVNPIISMAEDHDGNLWAADNFGHFYHIREGRPEGYPLAQLVNKSRVRLMADREGLLWIGTGSSGLYRLRKTSVAALSVEHGLSHHLVLSIHRDKNGIVWVGTNGKGVCYFENGTFKPFAAVPDGHIWATLTDSKGDRWFGTWGGGLIRVKGDHVQTFTRADGLADNVVRALYEDSKQNLWIGTGSGLSLYKNGVFKNFQKTNGFKGDFVISLLEDSRGVLWVGTVGSGLNRFEEGRFTNYSIQDGLSDNHVRSLYEDDSGSLWIGTYGGGLNRFKDGTFAVITTEHGLYDNGVFCILEDHLGFFWMSCNRGVYRVARQELNDFADGKIKAVTCTYYNKADGMKTAECNGGFQPAGCKTTDGKLWFPTIRGAAVFDPGQVTVNRQPPPVMVEKMIVDGKEIDPGRKWELGPGTRRFEFHYTGLSFPVPERVRFRFKLEGLEDKWRDVGTRRVAYYNQVPPGNYTFRVKACNNNGIWNETGAAVSFYLKPYFYQAGWFYLLVVLFVLVVMFSLYRFRVGQLRKRQKELGRLVELRTVDLAKRNMELKNAHHELRQAKEIIELKNRNIMDSIRYARKIQQAMLPKREKMERELDDYFVIFEPKDIVSGDFYWFDVIDGQYILLVADCTGHGVPGALLSIVGYMMLNEVVSERHITDPAVVLSQLHLGFRSVLKQEIGETDTYDGMDVGLCLIDLRNGKITFAGARRSLFYIRDSELIEIKGSKKSIGGRQKEQKCLFTNHQIDIVVDNQDGIMIYLTTDGFADQHNAQNQKYGSLRLKKFLLRHAHLSTDRQKEMLLEELKKHRGREEQRDDITIIGIRIRKPK